MIFSRITESAILDSTLLSQLKLLDIESSKMIEILIKNLKTFQAQADNSIIDSLGQLTSQANITIDVTNNISKMFHATIGNSIKTLSNDLWSLQEQQQTQTRVFLFNGLFASGIVKGLEAILAFEKQLDQILPDMSKKIINILGSLLTGLIATYMPAIGLLIEMSGVLDKVKDFLTIDNLTIVVAKWKKQINEMNEQVDKIQSNPTLGEIYKIAKQIAELTEKTGISGISIAKLILSSESLKVVNNLVQDNSKEESFFKKIVQISDLMSYNSKDIEQKLGIIKEDLLRVCNNYGLQDLLPKSLQKELQERVNVHLNEAKKIFALTFSSEQGVFERILSYQKALENILTIKKDMQRTVNLVPGGKQLVEIVNQKVENLITSNVVTVSPQQLSRLKEYSGTLVQLFGLTSWKKILFNKNIATQNQEKTYLNILTR